MTGELLGVLALVVVGYIVSLKLNPWVTCSRCKNKPKSRGWVFGYAQHVCSKCQGSGLQLRFGRRFLFKRPTLPGDR